MRRSFTTPAFAVILFAGTFALALPDGVALANTGRSAPPATTQAAPAQPPPLPGGALLRGYIKFGQKMQYMYWPSTKLTHLAGRASFEGKPFKARLLRAGAGAAAVFERAAPLALFIGLGQTDIPVVNGLDTMQEVAIAGGLQLGITGLTAKSTINSYRDTYATAKHIDAPAEQLAAKEKVPFEVARIQVIADLEAAAQERDAAGLNAPKPGPVRRAAARVSGRFSSTTTDSSASVQ